MREVDAKEYIHEKLGDRFASALSEYDTLRRLEVLIDDFLGDRQLGGKCALDVGCGLGFFSQRLKRYGLNVTACDLGPTLVERTRRRVGCEAVVADTLRLVEQFGPEQFDIVVSSECIEHTPDPEQAVAQMVGVLKPGGLLSLSTPNTFWGPAVKLATALRLRPFEGYENFSSWSQLRRVMEREGVTVEREFGLHLFPFQLGFHQLSRWADQHAQRARHLMINICLLGRKQPRC